MCLSLLLQEPLPRFWLRDNLTIQHSRESFLFEGKKSDCSCIRRSSFLIVRKSDTYSHSKYELSQVEDYAGVSERF